MEGENYIFIYASTVGDYRLDPTYVMFSRLTPALIVPLRETIRNGWQQNPNDIAIQRSSKSATVLGTCQSCRWIPPGNNKRTTPHATRRNDEQRHIAPELLLRESHKIYSSFLFFKNYFFHLQKTFIKKKKKKTIILEKKKNFSK